MISENSHSFETRQATIQSMTQILAETCQLLPFPFIIHLIDKYYRGMVLLLVGVSRPEVMGEERHPEAAKVALGSYVKIFKKVGGF